MFNARIDRDFLFRAIFWPFINFYRIIF